MIPQHFFSLEDVYLKNSWLTIGSFDGVHIGHQSIIHRLVSGSHRSGDPAVVVTFYPHPAFILREPRPHFYLTTPEERLKLLLEMGVDVVITHPFNKQVAQLTAFEFINEMYLHLQMKRLLVGHDFALGRDRQGNVQVLSELGEQFNYQVDVVSPILLDNFTVSSSSIRAHLKNGEIEMANKFLGRSYLVEGQVVPGDGRGRVLGIPTANLDVWSEKALPKAGVYACMGELNGQNWGAVTNVGFRPTFEIDREKPQVETHLLNFDSDIYGKKLKLFFITRLRDEKRFERRDELVDQIIQDIEHTRDILAQNKK